ncbi:MAG: hypothetical protein WC479_04605 [Candidatus Izemoplasmatales bacterium]
MKNKQRVKCSVCGRIYVGYTPKSGDGTTLYPRMHYGRFIPYMTVEVVNMINNKQYCNGSFREGIPLD